MRVICLFFVLLFCQSFVHGQDTIYMKTGDRIPAIVLDQDEMEISYRKFTTPENPSIYSLFKSDILKIRYKNGKEISFATTNPGAPAKSENPFLAENTKEPVMKFSFGLGGGYLNRKTDDKLLQFWRAWNNDDALITDENKRNVSVYLSMSSPLGGTRRDWFGASLQVAISAPDAIHATFLKGVSILPNEIKFQTFNYNIGMLYGHTINHKKNLVLVFEPALDIGMMNGIIRMSDVDYKIFSISGIASQFSTGMDWIITKRTTLSLRGGYRFMQIDESHKSKYGSTGYSTFYVNPPDNKNLVSANWSGTYVSAGICFSLYGQMHQQKKQTK
jgi:hypothetical protein